MRSDVSFQVERVVEPLPACRTRELLDPAVAFHVPVQSALQPERLAADSAPERRAVVIPSFTGAGIGVASAAVGVYTRRSLEEERRRHGRRCITTRLTLLLISVMVVVIQVRLAAGNSRDGGYKTVDVTEWRLL